MPAHRGARGSYARYICNHCRKRKIKCVLPENLDIQPSHLAQPEATSCQRCVEKGLDCVVDFTVLGRPSHPRNASMTKITVSSESSFHLSPNCAVSRTRETSAVLDHQSESHNGIEQYLMVQPERTTGFEEAPSIPQRKKLQPTDKFRAMTNPVYLLSTLLRRDKQFASQVMSRPCQDGAAENLIDVDVLPVLDHHLVWHRLLYPDIPVVAILHDRVTDLHSQDEIRLAEAFLYVLICLLAVETARHTIKSSELLKQQLEDLVFIYGQRTLLLLPTHRHAILALELLTEYRPLSLVTSKILASDAIQARMASPLLKEIALDLNLHTAQGRLQHQLTTSSEPLDPELLHDCLKWYRLVLRDEMLSGGGRQAAKSYSVSDDALVDIVKFLEALLASERLPSACLFPFHSLLCQAYKLEYMLRAKENWKDLATLGNTIDDHKIACERQQHQFKSAVQLSSSVQSAQALAVTQLLDMQLHSAYCWVSGSATFYCIMAGAQAQQYTSANAKLDVEQAVDVSDQIIERFADCTSHLHASDPHTDFLVKYGSRRMDDLELTLLNYVSAIDNLKLDGLPFIPPIRLWTSHILYNVKDVMEGQAARMKGWGGLHERAHMHLLLIRDCANSLERVGGLVSGEVGGQAIGKGCLWAATARILRSLHRLLIEWKGWNTLGQAKISVPARTVKQVEGSDTTEQTSSGFDDFAFLPDDLFFDWDLWLREEQPPVS